MLLVMSYSATIELPTVKFGVVEATSATWTGPLVAAVPRLATLIIGWMVSPGCMVGGTLNAVGAQLGQRLADEVDRDRALTSFERSDSRTALVELTIRWT